MFEGGGKDAEEMKKLFIVFSLLFIKPALANWTALTNDDDIKMFIDLSTLSRKGNTYKAWYLANFSDGGQHNHYSSTFVIEIDCKDKRKRTLQSTAWTENNGGGRILGQDSIEEWKYIAPNSALAISAKLLCRK